MRLLHLIACFLTFSVIEGKLLVNQVQEHPAGPAVGLG